MRLKKQFVTIRSPVSKRCERQRSDYIIRCCYTTIVVTGIICLRACPIALTYTPYFIGRVMWMKAYHTMAAALGGAEEGFVELE